MVVDGTSNDEQGIASQRGSFSLESIREYVVYTNQFAPEYGQAAGALVNVVTRSGTNKLEGRLFAFYRADGLDAQNPFSKAQQSGTAPFSEHRGGGFLGGPIVKDQWHFFGSYELLRNDTTNVVTSPLVPVDQREVPEDNARDQYFFKTDYELPRNNQLGVRYRYDRSKDTGGGIGGLNPRERGYDNTNKYGDGVVSFTSVLSSRTVNEARVMYGTTYTFWTVDGYADPNGVSISRPSINQGKANNMPQGWESARYQFVDTLSHTIGHHDLKAGVDIQLDDQDTYFLGNKDGTFTFRTDLPFDAAIPATYPIPVHADPRRLVRPAQQPDVLGVRPGYLARARPADVQLRRPLRHRDDVREGPRHRRRSGPEQLRSAARLRLDTIERSAGRSCAADSVSISIRASTTSRATSATRRARRWSPC